MAYTDLLKYLNYITDPVPGSYGFTKVRTRATQYNREFGCVFSLIRDVIILATVIDFVYLTRLKGNKGGGLRLYLATVSLRGRCRVVYIEN